MRSLFRSLPLCLVLLGLAPEAGAQALGDRSVTRPVAGDPGLFSGQVLNEPQYRVLRDYAEPGATRRMHNHPEATFHVLVLLSGRLRITIEGEAPREVTPGEVDQLIPALEAVHALVEDELAQRTKDLRQFLIQLSSGR